MAGQRAGAHRLQALRIKMNTGWGGGGILWAGRCEDYELIHMKGSELLHRATSLYIFAIILLSCPSHVLKTNTDNANLNILTLVLIKESKLYLQLSCPLNELSFVRESNSDYTDKGGPCHLQPSSWLST